MIIGSSISRFRKRAFSAVQMMWSDESGTAVVEYALVMSVFSVSSGVTFFTLSGLATAAVQTHVSNMQSYGVNPAAFECQSATTGGCS